MVAGRDSGDWVEFETLKALQVLAGGEPLALGGPRQRAVLARLLVETPAAASVDRVIDELRGERPPASADHALQVYGSTLRKVLRPVVAEVALRRSAEGFDRRALGALAMGIHTIPASGQCYLARGELSGGDPASVLAELVRADAILASLGARGFRSTVQTTLAEVYERLGEMDQARQAVTLADDLTALVDSLTATLAATAHARLALLHDDSDAAESRARHGVEHAFKTDISFLRGLAQLELACVLGSLDRRQRSAAQVRGTQPVRCAVAGASPAPSSAGPAPSAPTRNQIEKLTGSRGAQAVREPWRMYRELRGTGMRRLDILILGAFSVSFSKRLPEEG